MASTVVVVFPVPRSPRSAHMGECSSSEPQAHDTRRSTACGVSAALLTFEDASSLRSSSNTPTTARVGTNLIAGSNVKRKRFDSASATSSEITDPFAEISNLPTPATTLSVISFTSFLTSSSLALLFLTSFKICSFDANKSFSAALKNSEDRNTTLTYCFSTTSTSSLKYGSASCSISSWRL